MKNKICIYLLLFICSNTFGQTKHFNYERVIIGNTDQWNKLELPNDIYGKISTDLSDLRIIGITSNNDTIEAPYIVQSTKEISQIKDVTFKLLNKSENENGFYFTFKLPNKKSINQIQLDFDNDNFDWKVTLEGSQTQKDWFTILKDSRILSIKNNQTNYQFSKLSFSDANYSYFRILIKSKVAPKLNSAKLSLTETIPGKIQAYNIKEIHSKENKKSKQTEIDIQLDKPALINHLKVKVNDSFDFYRPILISYVSDSTETERGWKYNYKPLTSGTLSSVELNAFKFDQVIAKRLKIVIRNADNQALSVGKVEVSGFLQELLVRFTKPATYYLKYGNKYAARPNYDISRFSNKIPKQIRSVSLGKEQTIKKESAISKEALFMNENWLWIVMGIMVLLLGWFTLKMMKKTEQE